MTEIQEPYGGTSPAQDTKIERCVSDLMSDKKMTKKYPSAKERKSHCIAICKSSIMKKKEGFIKLENQKLKFTSPFTIITEGISGTQDPNRVKIRGTMLKASTSRNGVTYVMEEIQKAKFSGNTISVNHTENVTDNVGFFKPIFTDEGLDYEGEILNTPYHQGIVEMAKKGLVKFCSIEAIAKELVKEGDENRARGLDITGLGLVKTPGIESATVAIAEAFRIKEDKNEEDEEEETDNDLGEQKNYCPKEDLKKEESMEEQPKEDVKPQVKEDDSMKKLEEKVNTLVKSNEILSKEIAVLKETPKTKGIVTEETKNVLPLIREKNKGRVDLYCDKFLY